MARRRASHSVSFAPIVIVAVLAVAGYLAWRYRDALLPAAKTPVTAATPAATAAALDVCALAPRADVAAALGTDALEARHAGAGADVPVAGACTWEFTRDGRKGSLVVLAFTRGSLARGAGGLQGHDYYASVVTGLEYELKSVPKPLAGLGDEAAVAGFEGGEGQVVARRGALVLQLVARGAARAATERAARAMLAAR